MLPERPYQKRGVEFALENQKAYFMVDMSLGKTRMAINFGRRVGKPILVFAPMQPAYSTWPEEISKWTDNSMSWTILHGPQKLKRLTLKRDFYIINYDGIKWLYNTLMRGKYKVKKFTVVFDESSYLKARSTKRFGMLEAMKTMFSPFRLCLSATPQPNGLHELWPQYYMLDDGERLGKKYTPFLKQYFETSGGPRFKVIPKYRTQERIYPLVEDITFRLDAEDYLELPKLIYNDVKISASASFKRLYMDFNKSGELDVGAGVSATGMGVVNKLHQLCQGAIYDKNKDVHILHKMKLEALVELVNASPNENMLVAIQYRFEIDMIQRVFGPLPMIVGGMHRRERTNNIIRWNRGQIPLMLCHPSSLSHGVNMHTGGRLLTFYGIPWGSFEVYKQLIGRIRRHGRIEPVIINNILIQGTDDIAFAALLRMKGACEQDLLDYQNEITKRRHM
jgi:SNF2 family DNA or RNA helicase